MAIDINETLDLIYKHIKPVGYEIVPIEAAVGRISAIQLKATYALPRFNNSAMDGYGVKIDDKTKTVKVIDTILAGSSKQTDINSCEVIKIMTGARVPSSVEAIVPYEDVEILDENNIILPKNIKQNQHIRFIGEDVNVDDMVVDIAQEINFAVITLLVSQGITHIKVYQKPKIVVFASGEELKLHYDKTIEPYQLFNSNTPTLSARAIELGCDVRFVGLARDSVEGLKELILNSLDANMIITSGGVSVGDADFTQEAFEQMGIETIFQGIKIKPGKPTILGKIGNTAILNLPGNPLAASSIFELFGKIIIQILSGTKEIYHNTIKAKLQEDLPNKKGRPTVIVGFFDGEYFTPSQKRSPGMVSVLANCNSMILLEDSVEFIAKDSVVEVLPINWKFFTKKYKNILTK